MQLRYMPKNVEFFMQYCWENNKFFRFEDKLIEKKYYCLCMFPYPSGKLHIGHVRNYTIGDIIAGYARLNKMNVLNPIGWDSFGIPAENAALKNNIVPKNWTMYNINAMRIQLKRFGFGFDWSREITTSNPNYYKWEQLFFIRLYKSGLVYRKDGFVNWDPADETVLANEQVIHGRGWRSNVLVKKIKTQQWYIKVTEYADELINQLNLLKGWPEKVKEMQRNWIGKSIGYEITLYISGISDVISIFLNNIFDICFLVEIFLYKNHFLASYFRNANNVLFNPITKKKILITLVDNEEICSKELELRIENKTLLNRVDDDCFFNYLKKSIIVKILINIMLMSDTVKKKVMFNLQDWCISRQRFWGTPIPMIYCASCGVLAENENNVPIILPKTKRTKMLNFVLKTNMDFGITKCINCNGVAYRETDTFDTFFESSWYYIKYLYSSSLDLSKLLHCLPVDQYIGGIEHATMHLIYARFFHKLMRDFCIVNSDEPFTNLLTQGMVLMGGSKMSKSKGNIPDQELLVSVYGADTLRLFIIFAAPPEQSFEWTINGIKGCKKFLEKIWKYAYYFCSNDFYYINDIDFYNFNFSDNNINIIKKYNNIVRNIHVNLSKSYSFNVVVALLMQMFNLLDDIDVSKVEGIILGKKIFQSLLIFLFPITPHICNFIWCYIFKEKVLIVDIGLPDIISNLYINIHGVELIVLINNKFKTKVYISEICDNETVKNLVLNNFIIKTCLANKIVKEFIYKKNKIVNIVI